MGVVAMVMNKSWPTLFKAEGDWGHDLSQALEKLKDENTLKDIIGKLADGLRAFIGYGKGQGIADLVDPLQQLRKGVLEFLKMMLDKLKSAYTYSGANNSTSITEELSKAVINVNEKFEEAIDKVVQINKNSGTFAEVVKKLKNISDIKNKNSVQNLANGFKKYLEAVLGAVENTVKEKAPQASSHVQGLCSQLQTLMDKVGKQSGDISSQISAVVAAKTTLNANKGTGQPSILIEGVTYGTDNMLIPLKKKDGYKSPYQGQNWDLQLNKNKIPQIFLGCLPLYYYWLTYLYWKCKQTREKGGWETQRLSGAGGVALKNFLVGQGYNGSYLNAQNRGVNGSSIASLIQSLGMSSTVTTSITSSHTDLLSALDNSLKEVIGSTGSTTLNTHSLSALFYLCRTYFIGKQIMQSKRDTTFKPRPPTSIREMLYWLSGLQFSPHYSSIEKQIESLIPHVNGLPVADSSISSTKSSGGDTLTQSQMKGFLLSSCLSAPGVLGVLQGNSADTDGEPWLYSLFSNSMNLQYPSGSALFNTLANYSYALQFQLLFLYAQCRSWYSQSYGWQWCRYGRRAQPTGQKTNELASWICSAPNCSRGYSCPHNSNTCDHIKQCGQNKNGSPLQAFLTDNLKGFHVSQKPDPLSTNHLDNHPPGSMCHVPMGFASALTTDANATGWYIYYLLDHFCSGSKTPLLQLCEKLGCLTKRTPRSLGDLFGFLWHLNGQLFKDAHVLYSFKTAVKQKPSSVDDFITNFKTAIGSNNSRSPPEQTGIVKSFESMAPAIPFLYQLFMLEESNSVPDALFDLTYHCHRSEMGHSGISTRLVHKDHSGRPCSTANDLWSLYQPVAPKPTGTTDTHADCRGQNCGGYLYPLTHTTGSAFAPTYASSYLSWFLYLTEDLQERLNELKRQFEQLKCADCNPGCTNQGICHVGTNVTCHCDSVVKCSGVLPLLYANGFTFGNAYSLKGGMQGSDSTKRSCQKFYSQLNAVLTQDENTPLFKLLTVIDDFLYMFRFYFFYNLSSFWIMYVCIVLYIYFLRADLLHFKSHVHFPSSHGIPSIGLLTTGKSTVLTKLTKLTYFMP